MFSRPVVSFPIRNGRKLRSGISCGLPSRIASSTVLTIPSCASCGESSDMVSCPPYREVWAVDFEFTAPPGERPTPLCMVARELRSCQLVRTWLADSSSASLSFHTGPDVLFVAYYASAELGFYLALDWPIPVRILDLFA